MGRIWYSQNKITLAEDGSDGGTSSSYFLGLTLLVFCARYGTFHLAMHCISDNRPLSRKRKNARNVVYVRDVTVGVHPWSPLCTQTYGGYGQCML